MFSSQELYQQHKSTLAITTTTATDPIVLLHWRCDALWYLFKGSLNYIKMIELGWEQQQQVWEADSGRHSHKHLIVEFSVPQVCFERMWRKQTGGRFILSHLTAMKNFKRREKESERAIKTCWSGAPLDMDQGISSFIGTLSLNLQWRITKISPDARAQELGNGHAPLLYSTMTVGTDYWQRTGSVVT